jgi:peptidoglycan/xylan/chitin deacetylase (PgdA/CDA1 family)
MDHAHYAYSALPSRLAPNAAPGLQAYVLLCLEHWHAEPPAGAVREPRFMGEFGSFTPDYRSWTQREYGLRVGVFRVIEALQQAGLRPAVAASARLLERHPGLLRTLSDWGCEWVGHGVAANELMHAKMPLDEQRLHIAQALQAHAAVLGQQPTGWLSQDWGTTPQTFDLLAEAGLGYTLDWCNDDQPYFLNAATTQGQRLLAVPLSPEWDDVQCQWLRNMQPHAHAQLSMRAFEQMQLECSRQGRSAVFGLALHPWVCGMSSRIGALRQLLNHLASRPHVHWTSPGELAAAHRTHHHLH